MRADDPPVPAWASRPGQVHVAAAVVVDVAPVRFGLLSTAPINAEILAAARESEFADVLTLYRRHYG
jgi:hypothetical protein